MKKAKNETAKNNEKAPEKAKDIAVDIIRDKEDSTDDLGFKKVFHGFDPDEVMAYINELRQSVESSTRMHESKLSSLKEELVLSNRERDSYAEKYRMCMAGFAKAEQEKEKEKEDKTAEYEAVIAQLKERNERLEQDNLQLRETAERGGRMLTEEYLGRISSLENENKQLSVRLDFLKRESDEMGAVSQKYDELFVQYNTISAQHELVKAEVQAKDNEAKLLRDELERKATELNENINETEKVKRALAQLEIESNVIRQRLEENEAEITRLRDVNQAQAVEYAEKISALESKIAAERLAAEKQRKLRDYYVEQAQLTLAELSKQMEQIKTSMGE